MILLISNFAYAEPMCPTIRERLTASNYRNDFVEVYFGYACENRLTTVVFKYDDHLPVDAVKSKAEIFTTKTCQALSNEYNNSDDIGREIMDIAHRGGYVFVYKHPLLWEDIVHVKTFKECIQ
jgi:hypothetical protein